MILDLENIKALALDLDGTTLAPGAVLTERTVRAVRACADQGLRVIITTGRAIQGAESFRERLGVEGPMVYFNGAVVADMPWGTILNSTLLAKEAAEFCVDLSRNMGVYYQIFFPGTEDNPRQVLMTESWGPGAEMYLNHTGIRAELGDLKEALSAPGLEGCIKSMFLAEPEILETLRASLTERFGNGLYVARTLRTFLEVMDYRVSKGRGLRLALEYRGLEPSQAMAFGDEENDLPMFEAAAYAAAPSNAKESVLNAADLVIGSNTEDGLAAFLEETFL
jgi:Cof subfamily protein (haloacid dehalogenase superfamily)